MRFFTPELYIKTNADNSKVANQAIEDWEEAIKQYRRHCKKIAPSLPENFRAFCSELCLHDADFFGPAWLSSRTVPWGFQNVAIVVQNINSLDPVHLGTMMVLQYAI